MTGAITLDERSNSISLKHNQVIRTKYEENEKTEDRNILLKYDSVDRNEMFPLDQRQPQVIEYDDDNDPDLGVNCACFNFWDFFNQEKDEIDDFVTIEFSPTKEFEDKKKSMEAFREHETIDKQEEKGLMLHDDVKYNEDVGNLVPSKSDVLDMPSIQDISDRSSSSLSFDVNDFEEKEIEPDFGMKEKNLEVNIYFKLTETNLPTIIEDKSFSFAVCTQFNQIFSCV